MFSTNEIYMIRVIFMFLQHDFMLFMETKLKLSLSTDNHFQPIFFFLYSVGLNVWGDRFLYSSCMKYHGRLCIALEYFLLFMCSHWGCYLLFFITYIKMKC